MTIARIFYNRVAPPWRFGNATPPSSFVPTPVTRSGSRWTRVVAAAVLPAALLVGGCEGQIGDGDGANGRAITVSAPQTGTIIPLYSSPRDGTWDIVIAGKRAHPDVPLLAVVNPHSGPGTEPRADYVDGIARLADAGIRVIGYVPTGYGARDEAAVLADIDLWPVLYPQVTGVFFDQHARRTGSEGYYRRLVARAKAVGLSYSIGNPGTQPAESYIGVVDTILVYESPGMPTLDVLSRWHGGYARQNFGVIPYGTSLDAAYVKSVATYVGYIYLTDSDGPNPWDRLASYFPALMAALAVVDDS